MPALVWARWRLDGNRVVQGSLAVTQPRSHHQRLKLAQVGRHPRDGKDFAGIFLSIRITVFSDPGDSAMSSVGKGEPPRSTCAPATRMRQVVCAPFVPAAWTELVQPVVIVIVIVISVNKRRINIAFLPDADGRVSQQLHDLFGPLSSLLLYQRP